MRRNSSGVISQRSIFAMRSRCSLKQAQELRDSVGVPSPAIVASVPRLRSEVVELDCLDDFRDGVDSRVSMSLSGYRRRGATECQIEIPMGYLLVAPVPDFRGMAALAIP